MEHDNDGKLPNPPSMSVVKMANILSSWGTNADDAPLLSHEERWAPCGKHLCKGTKAGRPQVPGRKAEEAGCLVPARPPSPGPTHSCRDNWEPEDPQRKGQWRQKGRSGPTPGRGPAELALLRKGKGQAQRTSQTYAGHQVAWSGDGLQQPAQSSVPARR